MPRLDDRLKAVARLISGGVHADIGSDHGHLLKALLASGRIHRGVAVENKQSPYDQSRNTLTGYDADVRYADGFAGIEIDEIDSVSLCGMGGELIARLLNEYPNRVPKTVIVQPNRCPEAIRRWALASGFRLAEEVFVTGRRPFVVIRFQRVPSEAASLDDPAYVGVDREAAERFGPLLIKRGQPEFIDYLRSQRDYLAKLQKRTPDAERRLDALNRILRDSGSR